MKQSSGFMRRGRFLHLWRSGADLADHAASSHGERDAQVVFVDAERIVDLDTERTRRARRPWLPACGTPTSTPPGKDVGDGAQ
jgi:hypothetical protein